MTKTHDFKIAVVSTICYVTRHLSKELDYQLLQLCDCTWRFSVLMKLGILVPFEFREANGMVHILIFTFMIKIS